MGLRRHILRFAAYSSLIFVPHWLAFNICKFISLFQSQRFRILTHSKGAICIDIPFHICGHEYIQVGEGFNSRAGLRMECLDAKLYIEHSPLLSIGNGVSINFRCHIGAINKIVIGDNVLIGSNVLITDHSHGRSDESDICITPGDRPLYSKGPVTIEKNVWIGENVCILSGVTIGRNSIIGANTVVTKDVPAYCIVAGNPMRIIRQIIIKK